MQDSTKKIVDLFFYTDINECASNPCMNDGTCVDHVDGFTCYCSRGFKGPLCNIGRYLSRI